MLNMARGKFYEFLYSHGFLFILYIVLKVINNPALFCVWWAGALTTTKDKYKFELAFC